MKITVNITDEQLLEWLKAYAAHDEQTIEEAAAKCISEWHDFCTYPAEVEASLKLDPDT
jgi:hypothetical protein